MNISNKILGLMCGTDPGGGDEAIFFSSEYVLFSESSHVAYQIKGNGA